MTDHYDVLIKNTTIVDGTGDPAYTGNLAILGERIHAIGQVDGTAAHEIDASGCITCPGFVDPHSHADLSILQNPLAKNFVMQGVTTFLGGNCGMSMAPLRRGQHYTGVTFSSSLRGHVQNIDWESFGEWLSRVETDGISINYIPLVGHSAIRTAVMADDFKRQASTGEIEAMKGHVEEAMRSGAFGISSSFDPGPGEYASYEEIIALAKVAGKYGGLYSPHTRYHQDSWIADDADTYGYGLMHGYKGDVIVGRYHGLLEAVEIAKKAGLRLFIAHLTPAYIIPQPQPELLQEAAAKATLIDIIDKPREQGVDVYFNAIAYTPSIGMPVSILDAFFHKGLALPEWMRQLTGKEFTDNLKDKDFREKVKELFLSGRFKMFMIHPVINPYWMDSFRVLHCANQDYEGKTIGEIARHRTPDHIVETVYNTAIEVVFDILLDDPEATWGFIYDVRENPAALSVFMQHPFGMPCIDSFSMPTESMDIGLQEPPPIAYGLYPHYIRTFVKERRLLSLEAAIHKATSLPAQGVLGLKDRGLLSPGAYADIVVFDLDEIDMQSSFHHPTRPPSGIEYVLVNGQIAYANMEHTGAKSGKVLRRTEI